jgi:metallo-beta-lactamase class B
VRVRNLTQRWLLCLLAVALFHASAAQAGDSFCAQCLEWNRPQKPFRVFGNTYYIGPHGLSSILITSEAGHVLIDGALPESAKQIVANIQSLGFRIEDVKVILNSHVHFDHAGAIAELQKLSGARVIASGWSAAVMKRGDVGRGDPQRGELRAIKPVANVHQLHDEQRVVVGGITLTSHLTPGHTPGGTSWTWQSCEKSLCHDMVYADSLTPVSAKGFRFTATRDYPHALEDFEKSFGFLETTPCDILITTHPESSNLWDRLASREKGATQDPMVNTGACRRLAQQGRERLAQRLAEEDQSPAQKTK